MSNSWINDHNNRSKNFFSNLRRFWVKRFTVFNFRCLQGKSVKANIFSSFNSLRIKVKEIKLKKKETSFHWHLILAYPSLPLNCIKCLIRTFSFQFVFNILLLLTFFFFFASTFLSKIRNICSLSRGHKN